MSILNAIYNIGGIKKGIMKLLALGLCFALIPVYLHAAPQSPGAMLGAYIPPTNNYTDSILAFDAAANFSHTHTLIFCDFTYNFEGWPYLLEQMRDAGKIPIITWQPGIAGSPDPSFSNASFLTGAHDADIIKMSSQIRRFVESSTDDIETKVYIRFAHEPNIRSAPAWPGHPWNGQDAEMYKYMFRYVHDLFYKTLGGAGEHVVWTWSVNYMNDGIGYDTFSNWKNLFPGKQYVDMVGLSGLNYGDHPTAGPGYAVGMEWLYMPILRDMMAGSYGESGAYSIAKEVADETGVKAQGIFEFGTVGGSEEKMGETFSSIPKPQWILQAYDSIRTKEEFRYVRLVIWYNDIATSGGLLSDFRAATNPYRNEQPVPARWTQAYRDAIHGAPYFLEEPLSIPEMTPDGYYKPASLIEPADYPQHELWLNTMANGIIKRGDTLSVMYAIYPARSGPKSCDVYLAATTPDGLWYIYLPSGRWTRLGAKPIAVVKGLGVASESRGVAFNIGTQNLGYGHYRLYSILVPPGTSPMRGGPDLKISDFYLTP